MGGLERAETDQAVGRFEEQWQLGRPDLGRYLADAGKAPSVATLAALVKIDLRCRYDRGERPEVAEYLDRYPGLIASDERVLSLLYEEYCLREEHDGRPDPKAFCARYELWRDSLESQLRYHRVLSRAAGSMPPRPRFPERGERFGTFLIGAELGRGAAGRVYLARDESLGGREVALKVSHDRGSEPSTQGRLNHPQIVPVLSVMCQARDGTTLRGLCMPYRPGRPLDQVIRLVNPASRPARACDLQVALRGVAADATAGAGWTTFPERGTYADGVAWVVAALADALAYAHRQQIFHRDVKPANILLTYGEGPQLLDFNLSHDPHSAVEAQAALTGGTLPYMAPEQLEAFLDPERWNGVVGTADLYSLGLVLRELLTGRAPETPDPALPLPRAIRALLDQRADFQADLRRLNPRVPHALDAIAGRCLAFDPARRYADADALAEDLRRFLARKPLTTARNPSVRERAVNRVVRHRAAIAALVLAATFAALVFVLNAAWRRHSLAQAVNELDAGRTEPGLDILKRMDNLKWLGPDTRVSTLGAFYTAVAYARAGRVEQADQALERAWSRGDAGAVLTAWGLSHPCLTSHAEQLSEKVLKQSSQVNAPRKMAMLDRAAQTYRLVLRLNRSSYWARQGLAVVDEGRERYDTARDALTALIASLGVPRTADGRKQLSTALMIRARVLNRLAGSLRGTWGDAEARLAEALADLDEGDRLVPSGEKVMKFELNYLRCETTLACAEVADKSGRPAEAVRYYEQAERLLDALAKHPPERESAYRKLEARVKEQLRVETARLKLLISGVPPRHRE